MVNLIVVDIGDDISGTMQLKINNEIYCLSKAWEKLFKRVPV